MTRRRLTQAGLLIAAAPIVIGDVGGERAPYLYDPSLDLAGRRRVIAHHAGLRALPLAGDIGRAAHILDAGWRERASAVAGLTDAAAFFVIEQLARRRGLTLFRREGAQWAFAPRAACPSALRTLSGIFAS